MKKALPGICRAANPLLFALTLLALFLVGLVSAFRSAEEASDKTALSWGTFWNGSYFSSAADRYQDKYSIGGFYYTDRKAPEITLLGQKNPTLEKGTDYDQTTLGYIATDNFDGDITDQVQVEELENQIAYTVTDSQGNSATVYRDVTFVDTTPPELTLTGGSDYDLPAHTEYVEPGVQALDLGDGDISAQVQVSGTVDNRMLGDNVLTYTVTDSAGNTATATRTVHVVSDPDPAPVTEDDKVIYLTFDDGPGAYTEQLLDLLDKYDVKVTFFVTDQFDDYIDMISEEASRGHSVGIHSYTHDFYDVYASVDAYFADFDKMQEIVKEQTGEETTLFRFPGGSSNTISSFTPGVVTAIAQEAENRGLHYFDWNCSSGDASGTEISSEQVVANVTGDIAANPYNYSVVLQHDIKEFSVNAVEDIILWGLENGYIFRPLTEDSPGAHHGISN
jgi:peptidoglycan/xylan/chitin deacetylase (PgdA/CDA1 family)